MRRYDGRQISTNDSDMYKEQLENRGVKQIVQYETPKFTYPLKQAVRSLTIVEHVWTENDRLYKLADKYYGDSKLWWVLAKFNNYPTESHIEQGYVLKIPFPVDKLLSVMRG